MYGAYCRCCMSPTFGVQSQHRRQTRFATMPNTVVVCDTHTFTSIQRTDVVVRFILLAFLLTHFMQGTVLARNRHTWKSIKNTDGTAVGFSLLYVVNRGRTCSRTPGMIPLSSIRMRVCPTAIRHIALTYCRAHVSCEFLVRWIQKTFRKNQPTFKYQRFLNQLKLWVSRFFQRWIQKTFRKSHPHVPLPTQERCEPSFWLLLLGHSAPRDQKIVTAPAITCTHLSIPLLRVPHRGVPLLGVPQCSVPLLRVPHCSAPHWRVPQFIVPLSRVPQCSAPHWSVPHWGVPLSSVQLSGVPQKRFLLSIWIPTIDFIQHCNLRSSQIQHDSRTLARLRCWSESALPNTVQLLSTRVTQTCEVATLHEASKNDRTPPYQFAEGCVHAKWRSFWREHGLEKWASDMFRCENERFGSEQVASMQTALKRAIDCAWTDFSTFLKTF